MKCPQCGNKQKVKEGMACGKCRYAFALNPKERYGMTDGAFAAILKRLSGPGGDLYFTRDQLYAQVYRTLREKHHSRVFGCLSVFWAIAAGIGLVVYAKSHPLDIRFWLSACAASVAVFLLHRLMKSQPFRLPADIPARWIKIYEAAHPLQRLTDGTLLKRASPPPFEEEFANYAPERILITEHDDTAEMLILNRYHFDQKTLVVSARKHPVQAFHACQRFLERHPDLPVLLVHDCGESGLRLKARLLKDFAWPLKEGTITSLGLQPQDVGRLKHPMWRPPSSLPPETPVRETGKPLDNIRDGYRLPLTSVSPLKFMGGLGLAAGLGLALLSEELLAEQRRNAGNGGGDGGYG